MAEVVVPAGDPLAVIQYSGRTFSQAVRSCVASKLMAVGLNASDQTNFVQYFDELTRRPGDTIKYDLIPNPVGAGVAGDGVVAGQEVVVNPLQASLIINQLRQAMLLKGRMSQQRVPYSERDAFQVGLSNWLKEMIDYGLLNQLCGNTAQTNVNYTGMNSVNAPSSDHWFITGRGTVASGAAESDLDPSNVFSIEVIPQLVAMAQGTLNFPIKPVIINGVEVNGVLFLHPLQIRDMKRNFTGGEWGDIMRAELQGGRIEGNPLITGAVGMFNGVVIHQDAHVPWGDTSQNTITLPDGSTTGAPNALGAAAAGVTSVARGVFVGAQAAAFACGQADMGGDGKPLRVRWVEELLDAGNQLRITCGMVFGISKTRFSSSDYATIAVSSYATP